MNKPEFEAHLRKERAEFFSEVSHKEAAELMRAFSSATPKRIPAGRVFAQFMAGASTLELALTFNTTAPKIDAAIRRHMSRVIRRLGK